MGKKQPGTAILTKAAAERLGVGAGQKVWFEDVSQDSHGRYAIGVYALDGYLTPPDDPQGLDLSGLSDVRFSPQGVGRYWRP